MSEDRSRTKSEIEDLRDRNGELAAGCAIKDALLAMKEVEDNHELVQENKMLKRLVTDYIDSLTNMKNACTIQTHAFKALKDENSRLKSELETRKRKANKDSAERPKKVKIAKNVSFAHVLQRT